MIEANEFCRPYLEQVGVPYEIAVLGERDNIPVVYWMDKENLMSTGNSYYRELTECFKGSRGVGSIRATRTLDSIVGDRTYDFIKIDTQGSELDIFRGGQKTLAQSNYVLMEVANEPYNEHAPLRSDVVRFMEKQDFVIFYEFDTATPKQKDVLFSRNRL